MSETELELLVVTGQIRAVKYILEEMDIDIKAKGIIEYFWNDLEALKDSILLSELKKIAPNQERFFNSVQD